MSESNTQSQVTGTVEFFNPTGEYGFIDSDENEDIFFHINDVEGFTTEEFEEQLEESKRIAFRVEKGNKGPRAYDVDFFDEDTEE